MSEFFQQAPQLANTFENNRWLKPYLRHKLPKEMFAHIEGDLHRLGQLCAGEYLQLARQAERELPVHVPYDAWGNRIDELKLSHAWQKLHEISAREGLVAIGYKRAHGEFSRVYQFAKLFLFHPSSAFYTCPLAMADGAARVLEIHGREEIHRQAFSHLTSESPQEFWTSGQWMTEKTGGSDVSDTSTVARVGAGGEVRLHGTKWFSSATTSEMALALARIEGDEPGSRGLTLFMTHLRESGGALNGIKILRLKDKLGTRALPTAELELNGTLAHQVGERGRGVKTVTTMLNITRLYNSICAAGQMARALEQLRDYAGKRKVFGTELGSQVLHYSTFALEEVKSLASFLLTMELAHLMGREECGKATSDDANLIRLLTPVAKLFTARCSVQVASEVLEGFGGVGYVEDSGIAVHLRDAQVFPIWEGATNVLSLDLLRVMHNKATVHSFSESVRDKLAKVEAPEFKPFCEALVKTTLTAFAAEMARFEQQSEEVRIASSRPLAFFMARLYSYVLLLHWAGHESPPLRAQLMPWIEIMGRDFVGSWQIKPADLLNNERQAWNNSLTV